MLSTRSLSNTQLLLLFRWQPRNTKMSYHWCVLMRRWIKWKLLNSTLKQNTYFSLFVPWLFFFVSFKRYVCVFVFVTFLRIKTLTSWLWAHHTVRNSHCSLNDKIIITIRYPFNDSNYYFFNIKISLNRIQLDLTSYRKKAMLKSERKNRRNESFQKIIQIYERSNF